MDLKELLDKVPVVKHWTVRYDGIFEMPMDIQGEMVNTFGAYEEGASIVIEDIICLDLKSNIVTTDFGEIFILAGSGTRMILTDHIVPDNHSIWKLNRDLVSSNQEDEDDD